MIYNWITHLNIANINCFKQTRYSCTWLISMFHRIYNPNNFLRLKIISNNFIKYLSCFYCYNIWNYKNHHVMTCIGSRVNATFIPDNFDHVLIAVDITTLPAIFVKILWILSCHSPGLFVAPAIRVFCVAVKRLNGLEICSISVH